MPIDLEPIQGVICMYISLHAKSIIPPKFVHANKLPAHAQCHLRSIPKQAVRRCASISLARPPVASAHDAKSEASSAEESERNRSRSRLKPTEEGRDDEQRAGQRCGTRHVPFFCLFFCSVGNHKQRTRYHTSQQK